VDLIDFLNRRSARRKRLCRPGRLFRLRYTEPKRLAIDEVEFWQDGSKLGSLTPHQGRSRRLVRFNCVSGAAPEAATADILDQDVNARVPA
jgi:hypothetical protein